MLRTVDMDMDSIQTLVSPIRLLIEFCSDKRKRLELQRVIVRSHQLPMDLQLKIVTMDTISVFNPSDTLKILIETVCPDDVSTASETLQFYAILKRFCENRTALDKLASFDWNESQIPLSFLMFSVHHWISKTLNHDHAYANWLFIRHFMQFCAVKEYDAAKLMTLWNTHDVHFGSELIERVCTYYNLKHSRFVWIAEMFNLWYSDVVQSPEILDADLWTEDLNSTPLFKLEPSGLWAIISQWIKNDVHYKAALEEMKALFKKYNVSGAVVCFLCLETQQDIVLIENILTNNMKQYLTVGTMKVMVDSVSEWVRTTKTPKRFLRNASSDIMAQLIMEFPLRKLKDVICEKRMDGNLIMKSPDLFENAMGTATGWTQSECQQINEMILRRSSFSSDQIVQNVQEIGLKNGLSQMVIDKMKSTLLGCDLENIHYRLRTQGIIRRGFGDSVLDLLSELTKDQSMDEHVIANYFRTISSAFIMTIGTDGDHGHRPWQCVCCGNLNVHKIIGYQMVIDIPICSLCGVSQMEGITMAIKGINMPFQTENANVVVSEDATKIVSKYESEAVINKYAEEMCIDLHCMSQMDSTLCPSLKLMAKTLMEQREYFMITEVEEKEREKSLTADHLRDFVTVEEYKNILLNSVDTVMAKEQPGDIEPAMQILTKMFDDEEQEICDFAPHYLGGKRKVLVQLLVQKTNTSKRTANKIRLTVKKEFLKSALAVAPKRYQEWLKQLDVDNLKMAENHIQKYHLKDAPNIQRMSIYAFFQNVLHFDDESMTVIPRHYVRGSKGNRFKNRVLLLGNC